MRFCGKLYVRIFSSRTPVVVLFFFFSSRRRHTRSDRDWSSDVCSSDLHNALVWQDTRTAADVAELAAGSGIDRFRAQTGLPLATYFSALKIRWILDHVQIGRASCRERV